MRRVPLLLPLSLLLLAQPAPAAEEPQGAAWLGVMLDDPREPSGEENAAAKPAVRIRGIVADGPAEQAHLRAQDRVLAMDGEGVATSAELMARLRALPVGTRVLLSLERAGRPFEAAVRLGQRPEGGVQLRRGWIGVSAIDLPPALREHFGGSSKAGVMIAAVQEGSPAEAAGLRLGDLVLSVGGQEVGSVGALGAIVAEWGIENRVEVAVVRDGADLVVEPVVGIAPERVPPPGD